MRFGLAVALAVAPFCLTGAALTAAFATPAQDPDEPVETKSAPPPAPPPPKAKEVTYEPWELVST